jgi:adenylate kinase
MIGLQPPTKLPTSTANFVLMGAPGAGKGTQATILARRCALPAISTGEIFRAHLAQQTEIGVRAKQHMDIGEYVPDELTNAMVRDRLSEPEALSGFVLDGYPRTEAQVKTVDEMLAATDSVLDAVVALRVDREKLLERLLTRAGVERRADDTVEIIHRRQDVYAEQTQPLLDIYRARGLLVEVDEHGSVEKVSDRLLVNLQAFICS